MTLPLCACGAEAVAFRPGSAAVVAPGSIIIKRGEPVTGRCMACLCAPAVARVLECYRCGGTSEDGLAFDRQRKPRGRPLLCTDCAADPASARPVFVAATHRRHAAARAASPQSDLVDRAAEA